MLSPTDEKYFKILCRVLQKEEMTFISTPQSQLNRLKQYVDSAVKLESAVYKKQKAKKGATWLSKLAESADIEMDEALKDEIKEANKSSEP